MFNTLTLAAVSLGGAAATSLALLPTVGFPTEMKLPPFSIIKEFEPAVEVATREAAPEPQEPQEPRLICKSCNTNEKIALDYFQDRGVKDKNALATILGNIKQESNFHPNICEGGARISYSACHRGGYGLIQWTSIGRYNGLGTFAQRYGGNPSSLDVQLRYLINEPQWRLIEPKMKAEGHSIDSYMNTAWTWIGWGHHGARTLYAYDYTRRFILSTTEV